MAERVIKSEPQSRFTTLWVGKVAACLASSVIFVLQPVSLM